MKKIFLPIGIILICCLTACNNKAGVSSTARKNLDALHSLFKCFETKDFSRLGEYIDKEAIDHAGEEGDIEGLAAMRMQFEKWAANVENEKSEIIKELADDEYAMAWMRFTGTSKTDQMGMKAGDKFDRTALEVARFRDGKIMEHWTFIDGGEMMKIIASMQ